MSDEVQKKFHFLKINQIIVISDPSVVRISFSNHLNYFIEKIQVWKGGGGGGGGLDPPDPPPGSATVNCCDLSIAKK